MEIDGDVEPFLAETPRQGHVVAKPCEAARALDDDDFVQVRVVLNDGRGGPFDQIGEPGPGMVACQGAYRGRREHDVADEAQPDEQDAGRAQGSTVASSMSITGMSSLIGYTR